MVHAALRGFILAFGLILPLGVQNTFVFSQGVLHDKWVRSLPVVLTAAVCDTALIVLGVSGVSLLALQAPWVWPALSWAGVAFLGYVGVVTWRSDPEDTAVDQFRDQWPAARQVRFAASVSLLNPHAILDTVGVIGAGSLAYVALPEKAAYAGACIAVSWLWFAGLSLAGHFAGAFSRTGTWRKALNRISALVMWGVAARVLWGLVTA